MTLDQIRTFLAIADEGGVNAASKVLNKTQPAISSALSRLEAELGLVLFDRDGYRLTLSAAGRALRRRMAAVVDEAGKLERAADYLAAGTEPQVKISMEILAPIEPVARCLSELAADYPRTQFDLRTDVLGGMIEKLESGEVDLAVGPVRERRAKLEMVPVTTIQHIPVGPGHGLANLRPDQVITKSEIAAQTQIVMRDTASSPKSEEMAVFADEKRLFVTNYDMKKKIIAEGLGWGFIPSHLARRELAEGSIRQMHIEDAPAHSIEIFALRRRDKPAGPVAQALWRLLEEALGKQGTAENGNPNARPESKTPEII